MYLNVQNSTLKQPIPANHQIFYTHLHIQTKAETQHRFLNLTKCARKMLSLKGDHPQGPYSIFLPSKTPTVPPQLSLGSNLQSPDNIADFPVLNRPWQP